MSKHTMQIKLFLSIIPLVCLFGVALAAPVNDIQARGVGGVQGDDGLSNGGLDIGGGTGSGAIHEGGPIGEGTAIGEGRALS
ncbi:unnamed protein product [Mucor circinelloides]